MQFTISFSRKYSLWPKILLVKEAFGERFSTKIEVGTKELLDHILQPRRRSQVLIEDELPRKNNLDCFIDAIKMDFA